MIIKCHQAHKTHQSILKTSRKNPADILRTPKKHQEDIYRIPRENHDICDHLKTSVNICKYLSTSWTHLIIPIEYLINWGHPENIGLQLRTSENIWHHPEKKCPHRGWLCIAQGVVIHQSYNPAKNIWKQLRISENIGERRRTSWDQLRTHHR